jgi:hypothetical protein
MIKFTPDQPLTHQELLIDFSDLPSDLEFSVNVTGPLAQPYWATLKSDPIGQAQLFWRTQAAGDYQVRAKGNGFTVDGSFSVAKQEGEPEGEPTLADVKTVEETEPTPDPEPKPGETTPSEAKPRARRKTTSTKTSAKPRAKRTTGSKAR